MSRADLVLGCIADDLTGGVELAGLLAAGGAKVSLVTTPDVPGDDDAEVVVIALRTRVAPVSAATAAFRAAAAALRNRGATRLFYMYCATFDSTPAGNIGPCADVLMEATAATSTIFCPSFPEADRTVYRGHLFYGDQLVSHSPKRLDPLTPMIEPDLVKVLQAQTARRVGLISRPSFATGSAAITRAIGNLESRGIAYAIVDAVDEPDLATIAGATWNRPLVTGGSSIAAHFPRSWKAAGLIPDRPPQTIRPVHGDAAVLVGSCADRSREQVAEFEIRHPVCVINLAGDEDTASIVARALSWARAQDAGQPVCITISQNHEAVEAAQALLGRSAAAQRGETILGRIAQGLVAAGVRRLVVAGGETSGAVMDALGIRQLTVAPHVSAGMGLCLAEGPLPLALCLKPGKLGPPELFETVLERMGHG